MIKIRQGSTRGFEDKGWLQTYHTFSFDNYYDPEFLGFRQLRVINEDYVKGGKGFGSHMHKDMEILTYVIEGALEHQDSLGHNTVIRPGEVQRMTAGTGVMHSEYNLSHHFPVHFLQIWIYPETYGLEPSYASKLFSSASKWGTWCLICSRNGREGSLRIHQDVDLYATLLDDTDELVFDALMDRYYWIQIVSGKFFVQESTLQAGDGAAISNESAIKIRCLSSGELLLFDVA
jgi:redox-sensitive bicupin YhaK (pirin superfamily)